jgi:hypothetical protein
MFFRVYATGSKREPWSRFFETAISQLRETTCWAIGDLDYRIGRKVGGCRFLKSACRLASRAAPLGTGCSRR